MSSLVVLACVMGASTAAAAAPATTPPRITLTATATFSGVAAPQRYSVPIPFAIFRGLKVVSRPDAATVVVVDQPTRSVVKHRRRIEVAEQPCVRGTLHVMLLPVRADPLDAVRLFLPVARREGRSAGSLEGEPIQTQQLRTLGFRSYTDVPRGQGKTVRQEHDVYAMPWNAGALWGTVVQDFDMHRLRVSGACRNEGWDDDPAYYRYGHPGSAMFAMAELGLVGVDEFLGGYA